MLSPILEFSNSFDMMLTSDDMIEVSPTLNCN